MITKEEIKNFIKQRAIESLGFSSIENEFATYCQELLMIINLKTKKITELENKVEELKKNQVEPWYSNDEGCNCVGFEHRLECKHHSMCLQENK